MARLNSETAVRHIRTLAASQKMAVYGFFCDLQSSNAKGNFFHFGHSSVKN